MSIDFPLFFETDFSLICGYPWFEPQCVIIIIVSRLNQQT